MLRANRTEQLKKFASIDSGGKVFYNPINSDHASDFKMVLFKDEIQNEKRKPKYSFDLEKINFFSKNSNSVSTNAVSSTNLNSSLYTVKIRKKKIVKKKSGKKKRRKYVRCNCKSSECLKLYCECFRRKGYCADSCKCFGCKNNKDFETQRKESIENIMKRNPDAFKGQDGTITQKNGGAMLLNCKNYCNCKKTKCLKKYCDCFTSGNGCSDLCKCQNCENRR